MIRQWVHRTSNGRNRRGRKSPKQVIPRVFIRGFTCWRLVAPEKKSCPKAAADVSMSPDTRLNPRMFLLHVWLYERPARAETGTPPKHKWRVWDPSHQRVPACPEKRSVVFHQLCLFCGLAVRRQSEKFQECFAKGGSDDDDAQKHRSYCEHDPISRYTSRSGSPKLN